MRVMRLNVKYELKYNNNIMNRNYLLLFMIIVYIITIYYIYFHYCNSPSVSSIICNNKHKYIIFSLMSLIGGAGILYEIERKDTISICLIILLVIFLLSLICIPEYNFLHYLFAGLLCSVILGFMIQQTLLKNFPKILSASLCLEFLLLFIIIDNIRENIFISEVLYILNFAFYYIYLHFIKIEKILNSIE